MDQLLTLAIQAAVAAGNEIMKVYNEADFEIELKSDNSPLTKADKAAHQIITSYLANTLPILSEEGKAIPYEIRKDWNRYWLIDPLDGTKEFIKKNGEFTVNIALINNKTPVLGVIYAPVIGLLYFADKNGAFRCPFHVSQATGNTLNLSQAEKLPLQIEHNDYVVVGSRSHFNSETEVFVNTIDTQGKKLTIINKGSSLKLCLVATGEADCYPRFGPTMEWDIAAGHAIASFAGKSITKPDGTAVSYNKENLLSPFFIVK